jgi:hypothetical protein
LLAGPTFWNALTADISMVAGTGFEPATFGL